MLLKSSNNPQGDTSTDLFYSFFLGHRSTQSNMDTDTNADKSQLKVNLAVEVKEQSVF